MHHEMGSETKGCTSRSVRDKEACRLKGQSPCWRRTTLHHRGAELAALIRCGRLQALHVMKDSHAVPLGILAKPPSLPDGVEQPLFAIASPNSFYSVYRQKCHMPQGANHCATYPLNSKEVVRHLRAPSPMSPSCLAGLPSRACRLGRRCRYVHGGPLQHRLRSLHSC